jgi:hypothetical protein
MVLGEGHICDVDFFHRNHNRTHEIPLPNRWFKITWAILSPLKQTPPTSTMRWDDLEEWDFSGPSLPLILHLMTTDFVSAAGVKFPQVANHVAAHNDQRLLQQHRQQRCIT